MTPLVERINPLTALGVAVLVDLVLLVSVDAVTAATAALAELALAPFTGIPPVRLARRATPLLAAAAVAAVTIALYGRTAGVVHLRWGLLVVSDGSLSLALATALRILAIGLPAAMLLAGMDATRLADALGGRLHLPARFVLAGLAAVRLVEVFGEDWRTIALARRARGVGDTNRLRRLPAQVFGLLVVALRRAGLLATAMEARGLGATDHRTWSRPSPFGGPDLAVLVAGVVVAALAVTVGLVTGSYRVVLG